MVGANTNRLSRESGWSVRPVTRKIGGRPVRPIGYSLVTLPQTPQEQIDICLACPLPDCQRRGCELMARGLRKK
jgi:hypothetical protein